MVNMIYATHIPKRERKRALRDVYAMEPVAPKFNPWSSCPITFDQRDHPTSIRHGGFAALVLDPIIDGFHLTRVLMDGGSSLNLLYQDTVGGLRISGQFLKRGVNLRYSPVSQCLSCSARANRICKVQCGTALHISQAQDARPSRS